jgi:glucose/arabinose dehydrogenase
MKILSLLLTGVIFVWVVSALSSCATETAKTPAPAAPAAPAPAAKAEAKAPPAEKTAEKAKAEKVAGDVGLLDLEKNYMILVTKEGKLITVDFDPKTKATEIASTPAKIVDVGLGSSAVVVYEKAGNKSVATSLEFKAAKGE